MPPKRPEFRKISDNKKQDSFARPTLRTLAELTGLGVTTVSRALKDAPELSVETKARVRALAEEIGYRPDRAGIRLRTGKTLVIALVLDQSDAIAEFARRMIFGISEILRDTPYHLVVFPQVMGSDPMEPITYIAETAAADGVIFTHTRPQDPRVKLLLERGMPFVTHGRTRLGHPHPFHDFDNETFARLAVEHLVARGRKRLALVTPRPEFTYAEFMLKGFREAADRARVQHDLMPGLDLDSRSQAFRKAAMRLGEAENPFDGFICASETRSVALMAGLNDAGRVVGRDVDVVAKETSDLLDNVWPPIDSFCEDLVLAGKELASFLLARMRGAPVDTLTSLATPGFRQRTGRPCAGKHTL
ncbi:MULTISPECIES: LacI family transcriptional regulator [Afifella]|uniref:LacI family transcriptional regulator n=1 Tax=Afifella marina DSM 2698 TaxID=1120955 RepID=A0A1G5MTY5_AFIMA|nr:MULTISPECIES: LacI family transcriptional regulator [Afifella]MCF1503905.1 LacI family transcriptional regulator [Afifella sp. H1R]SCZ28502.1 LacI family transcriptional regulator [Afifella marina DSM 2698]